MSKTKRLLIILLSVVLVAGILLGVLFYLRAHRDPIGVYEVSNFSMTEYWGDNNESSGPVFADRMQDIYLSDTQTVTEILVQEGQQVRKGDKLMTFDTTLSEIALSRSEIKVQQLQLDLERAKKELSTINGYKPYVPPAPKPEPEPIPLEPSVEVPFLQSGTGTMNDPYFWMWDETCTYTGAMIQSMVQDSGTDTVYAVFAQREQNAPNGEILTYTAFVFRYTEEDGLSFTFFDYTPPQTEAPEEPIIEDTSSGFTASEIAQMRAEKMAEIKRLDLEYRMAQVDLAREQKEVDDGSVYAEYDGVVTQVLDEETARMESSPLIRLSGGGGYFVTGYVSELDREKLTVGTSVSIQDWNTGNTWFGTVTEISPYPEENYYSYGAAASYYPYTVQVEEGAELMSGSYVSLSYSTAESTGGFYMELSFAYAEGGKYYVFADNGEGVLEKRELVTGKVVDGYWLQVLGGVTMEDFVAFPYLKGVENGAKVVHSDMNELYGY